MGHKQVEVLEVKPSQNLPLDGKATKHSTTLSISNMWP